MKQCQSIQLFELLVLHSSMHHMNQQFALTIHEIGLSRKNRILRTAVAVFKVLGNHRIQNLIILIFSFNMLFRLFDIAFCYESMAVSSAGRKLKRRTISNQSCSNLTRAFQLYAMKLTCNADSTSLDYFSQCCGRFSIVRRSPNSLSIKFHTVELGTLVTVQEARRDILVWSTIVSPVSK